MTSLQQVLTDPARRPAVVAALTEVVDAEVAATTGLGGRVIRTGYATVNRLAEGFVPKAVNRLLPGLAEALDPFWQARDGRSFADVLVANENEAAEALLGVTDTEITSAPAAIRRVYGSLRGRALKHVTAALPRVGAALEQQAG